MYCSRDNKEEQKGKGNGDALRTGPSYQLFMEAYSMNNHLLLLLCLFVLQGAAWLTVNPTRCMLASRQRIIQSRLTANDNNTDRDDDKSSLKVELKEQLSWDDSGDKIPLLQSKLREEERDVFIPIFALISLAGLLGTYAYEMLRLASRGELYLPWGN